MERTLTEWFRLMDAVDVLREIYEEYPEIFTKEREDILLIAEEVVDE